MYIAELSFQKDRGPHLEIEEQSLPGLVLESIGDSLFGLLSYAPDFLYELRWGPKDPEFGIADRSVGHLLYTFGQWCGLGFGAHAKRGKVVSIPLTTEQVQEAFPSLTWLTDILEDEN